MCGRPEALHKSHGGCASWRGRDPLPEPVRDLGAKHESEGEPDGAGGDCRIHRKEPGLCARRSGPTVWGNAPARVVGIGRQLCMFARSALCHSGRTSLWAGIRAGLSPRSCSCSLQGFGPNDMPQQAQKENHLVPSRPQAGACPAPDVPGHRGHGGQPAHLAMASIRGKGPGGGNGRRLVHAEPERFHRCVTMGKKRIVIVGASLAGLRAAEALRKQGFDGGLVMLGAEAHLPYDRPPLSKELLKGDVGAAALSYHPQAWYDGQGIELILGSAATGLDPVARRVMYAKGPHGAKGHLQYDGLIIACGARARRLESGMQKRGVFVIRSIEDSLALKAALQPGMQLVVMGAGFIGAEVAASARALGVEVTVLEAAASPLRRVFGEGLGMALGQLHGEHGSVLRCGVEVSSILGHERVIGVELTDGATLPADVVVVGIGAVPNVEWLAGSGLSVGNGLLCDEFLWTGCEGVYAAGDVASCVNTWLGERVRGEQWTTAGDQGRLAALNLLAGKEGHQAFETAPYFWSDQYGCRIQSIGRTVSADLVHLLGSPQQRPFVGAFVENGLTVGAIAVNAPRQFAKLRPFVVRRAASADLPLL